MLIFIQKYDIIKISLIRSSEDSMPQHRSVMNGTLSRFIRCRVSPVIAVRNGRVLFFVKETVKMYALKKTMESSRIKKVLRYVIPSILS